MLDKLRELSTIQKIEYAGILILIILLGLIFIKYIEGKKESKQDSQIAGPGDVVEEYFNAMTTGQFDTANKYLDKVNEANSEALKSEEFFYKVHWALCGINIGDEVVEKDKAKVNVIVNKFNHMKIMVNVKRKLLERTTETTSKAEVEELKKKLIIEEYASKDKEIITNTYDINVINQEGTWKIVNDNIIKDILFGSKVNEVNGR